MVKTKQQHTTNVQDVNVSTVLHLFSEFKGMIYDFITLSNNINTALITLSESIKTFTGRVDSKLDSFNAIYRTLDELEKNLQNTIQVEFDKKFSSLDVEEIKYTLKTIESSIQTYNHSFQVVQELAKHLRDITVCQEETKKEKVRSKKELYLKVTSAVGGVLIGFVSVWKLIGSALLKK